MIEVETVTLEDEKEYAIMDTISINRVKYIYLCATDNIGDICIRKLSSDEKDILGLEDEEEFKMALQVFGKKYEDVLTGE